MGTPGQLRPAPTTLFFLIHLPPWTPLLSHALMTWSLSRSIQFQNNMSTPAVVVRVTVMENTAMIIISFHFVRLCFVLICFVSVQIAIAADLFLQPKFPAAHPLHPLPHLFFLFPQRPFDTLKSVLLRHNPAVLPCVSPISPFSLFINVIKKVFPGEHRSQSNKTRAEGSHAAWMLGRLLLNSRLCVGRRERGNTGPCALGFVGPPAFLNRSQETQSTGRPGQTGIPAASSRRLSPHCWKAVCWP